MVSPPILVWHQGCSFRRDRVPFNPDAGSKRWGSLAPGLLKGRLIWRIRETKRNTTICRVPPFRHCVTPLRSGTQVSCCVALSRRRTRKTKLVTFLSGFAKRSPECQGPLNDVIPGKGSMGSLNWLKMRPFPDNIGMEVSAPGREGV